MWDAAFDGYRLSLGYSMIAQLIDVFDEAIDDLHSSDALSRPVLKSHSGERKAPMSGTTKKALMDAVHVSKKRCLDLGRIMILVFTPT